MTFAKSNNLYLCAHTPAYLC